MSILAFTISDCAPGGSAGYKPKSTALEIASSRTAHLQNQVEFHCQRVVGVNQSKQRGRCSNAEVTHSQRDAASQSKVAIREALGNDRKLDIVPRARKREPS